MRGFTDCHQQLPMCVQQLEEVVGPHEGGHTTGWASGCHAKVPLRSTAWAQRDRCAVAWCCSTVSWWVQQAGVYSCTTSGALLCSAATKVWKQLMLTTFAIHRLRAVTPCGGTVGAHCCCCHSSRLVKKLPNCCQHQQEGNLLLVRPLPQVLSNSDNGLRGSRQQPSLKGYEAQTQRILWVLLKASGPSRFSCVYANPLPPAQAVAFGKGIIHASINIDTGIKRSRT